MRLPSLPPSILLSLLLFICSVLSSSSAQTCQIANCSECQMDDTNSSLICSKCEDTYVANDQQIMCFQPDDSNTDMIVSLCIGSAVVLGIVICIWYKCRSHEAKDSARSSSDLTAPASTFSPAFSSSCMGMNFGDPLECMQFTSAGATSNYNSIYNQQQKECGLYDNRFNQKRSVDSPFKNDCDRFAFKLDRKQNMFPNWADQVFERYTPTNPSKRSKLFSARFSETSESIPQDILEKSAGTLAALLASPVLEPISFLEKQSSKNSCSDQEDTTSKSTNATTTTTTMMFSETINNASPPTNTIFKTLKFTESNTTQSPITQSLSSPKLLHTTSEENFLPRNRSESNSVLIPKLSLNYSPNQSQTLSKPEAAAATTATEEGNQTKNSTLNPPTIPISAQIPDSQLNDCKNGMSSSTSNLIFKADKVKVPHIIVPMPTDPVSENDLEE